MTGNRLENYDLLSEMEHDWYYSEKMTGRVLKMSG